MAYSRVQLFRRMNVIAWSKKGVRNDKVINFNLSDTYQLVAAKKNTLFFIDIKQPTKDSTDVEFLDSLAALPNDKDDFSFFIFRI